MAQRDPISNSLDTEVNITNNITYDYYYSRRGPVEQETELWMFLPIDEVYPFVRKNSPEVVMLINNLDLHRNIFRPIAVFDDIKSAADYIKISALLQTELRNDIPL